MTYNESDTQEREKKKKHKLFEGKSSDLQKF